jgi:hypothetical protein
MKMKKSSNTGRATEDPNFTRLDLRCNRFHGCGPNSNSIYKKGCVNHIVKPTFCCEQQHPTQPDLNFAAFRLKVTANHFYVVTFGITKPRS